MNPESNATKAADTFYRANVLAHRCFVMVPLRRRDGRPGKVERSGNRGSIEALAVAMKAQDMSIPNVKALTDPQDPFHDKLPARPDGRLIDVKNDPIWLAAGSTSKPWPLSPDLFESVRHYFNDDLRTWAASPILIDLLNSRSSDQGGLLMPLSASARRRLTASLIALGMASGAIATTRTYLRFQFQSIRLSVTDDEQCLVVFEMKLTNVFWEESGGKEVLIWPMSGGAHVPRFGRKNEVTELGFLCEWLHGLGARYRGGGDKAGKVRFVRAPLVSGDYERASDQFRLDHLALLLSQTVHEGTFDLSVNRVASLIGVQVAADTPSESLREIGFALARRYTSDYVPSRQALVKSATEQFENLIASVSMEGASLATSGQLPVHRQMVVDRLQEVYLPLQVLGILEQGMLLGVLARRQEALIHQGPGRVAEDVLEQMTKFNLSQRFPMVSQISHHTEFYRLARMHLGVKDMVRDLEGDARRHLEHEQLLNSRRSDRVRQKRQRILGLVLLGVTACAAFLAVNQGFHPLIDLKFDQEIELAKVAALRVGAVEAVSVCTDQGCNAVALDPAMGKLADVLERKDQAEAYLLCASIVAGVMWAAVGIYLRSRTWRSVFGEDS